MCSSPRVSDDGKFVYYQKGPDAELASEIWGVPVDGGEEAPVLRKRVPL